MAETLDGLLAYFSRRGSSAKAVVWAHNSHLGDARATSMAQRGELNLGQLVRERYGAMRWPLGSRHIRARSPRRPTGAHRPNKSGCVRRCLEATKRCFTKPAAIAFYSGSVRKRVLSPKALPGRDLSEQSVSSIYRARSA
jgi:erythromycin esterase-like protein